MEESILLESGERVIVAVPQGEPCVFNKPRLEFHRPQWTDDSSASQCLYCKSKFTQIKRKHHCRACGRLFCSKCCNEKTVLTHLGMTEAERTCLICKPILSLLADAYSLDVNLKIKAAGGFHELIQKMKHMQEILEMGGMQTLIWLCGTQSIPLYQHLIPAIHILATQVHLQKYLLKAGIVQAITRIMQNLQVYDKLTTDCISTLLILSNQPESVHTVVIHGGLHSLMACIQESDELTRLLTLQIIVKMTSIPHSHSIIMNNINFVKYLLSFTYSGSDTQVTTLIFKVMAEISAGNDLSHKMILSAEESTCNYLTKTMKAGQNSELMLNMMCLTANLASIAESQTNLTSVISKLAPMIEHYRSASCYRHIVRLVANFSKFPQNSYHLLPMIPAILDGLSSNIDQHSQYQSLTALVNLLSQSPEETSKHISRGNSALFLSKLMSTDGIPQAIQSLLESKTNSTGRP